MPRRRLKLSVLTVPALLLVGCSECCRSPLSSARATATPLPTVTLEQEARPYLMSGRLESLPDLAVTTDGLSSPRDLRWFRPSPTATPSPTPTAHPTPVLAISRESAEQLALQQFGPSSRARLIGSRLTTVGGLPADSLTHGLADYGDHKVIWMVSVAYRRVTPGSCGGAPEMETEGFGTTTMMLDSLTGAVIDYAIGGVTDAEPLTPFAVVTPPATLTRSPVATATDLPEVLASMPDAGRAASGLLAEWPMWSASWWRYRSQWWSSRPVPSLPFSGDGEVTVKVAHLLELAAHARSLLAYLNADYLTIHEGSQAPTGGPTYARGLTVEGWAGNFVGCSRLHYYVNGDPGWHRWICPGVGLVRETVCSRWGVGTTELAEWRWAKP